MPADRAKQNPSEISQKWHHRTPMTNHVLRVPMGCSACNFSSHLAPPTMPTPVSRSETQPIESQPQPLEQPCGEIFEVENGQEFSPDGEVDCGGDRLCETEEPHDSDLGLHSQDADGSHIEPFNDCESSPLEPGSLLKELEARQDEVLESLDELDRQICEVLRSCGVTLDGEEEGDLTEVPIKRAA